jgi:hypothetical protein
MRAQELLAGSDEERRKDREEFDSVLRETQRAIDALAERGRDSEGRIRRFAEEWRAAGRKLGERIDQVVAAGRETDEQVNRVVSAIGELLQRQ